jgi:hypothetical protein
MVGATGFEPDKPFSRKGLSTGQGRSDCGQEVTQPCTLGDDNSDPRDLKRQEPDENPYYHGRGRNTTGTQQEHNESSTGRQFSSDLTFIVDAWERLPDNLRKEIVKMVKSQILPSRS